MVDTIGQATAPGVNPERTAELWAIDVLPDAPDRARIEAELARVKKVCSMFEQPVERQKMLVGPTVIVGGLPCEKSSSRSKAMCLQCQLSAGLRRS